MKTSTRTRLTQMLLCLLSLWCAVFSATATEHDASESRSQRDQIEHLAAELKPKVIDWRRDFHEHPELGNQEVRTTEIVAKHLESLRIEVQTGVAVTGVVGVCG